MNDTTLYRDACYLKTEIELCGRGLASSLEGLVSE